MSERTPRADRRGVDAEDLLVEAGWVRALARKLARDQASADDLAQSALAAALLSGPQRSDAAAALGLRPWLARVLARLAARQRRGDARRVLRERRAASERVGGVAASDELLAQLELQERLTQAVRALPDPYRTVVLRRYYAGESPAVIAAATGASAATVRSQLARGLERLRVGFSADLRTDSPNQGAAPFSALALFTLAAGDPGGILARRSAELLAMQTGTKIAVGLVAGVAAVITTGAWLGGPTEGRSSALAPANSVGASDDAATEGSVVLDPTTARFGADVRADATPAVANTGLAAPEESAAGGAGEEDTPLVSRVLAKLVDELGAPVVGGELRSIYIDGRTRGEGTFGRSDVAGRVALAIADEHLRAWRDEVFPMVFMASGEGRASVFAVSTPKRHGETDLGVLVLGPGGSLHGTVVDERGVPVGGAVLLACEPVVTLALDEARLKGPDPAIVRPRAKSDDSGRFEITGIPAGQFRIWAHAARFLWTIDRPVEVTIDARTDVGPLVLDEVPAALRISGIVLTPSGAPARGVEVAFTNALDGDEGKLPVDDAGRFVYVPKGKAESKVEFLARDPSGALGLSELVGASAGDTEVRLVMGERRVIRFTVVEPGGAPIADASLMAFIDRPNPMMVGGGSPLPGDDWTRTNEDGLAEILVPRAGFFVSVSEHGYQGHRAGPFEPASAPEALVVELTPEPRIEGRVFYGSAPVAGARITIGMRIPDFVPRESGFPVRFFTNQDHGIVSDAEGRFACPVDPEWSTVTVLARAPGFATGETELTLVPGKGSAGVVIEVTRGGSVVGKVLPPPGQPAAGLVVAASRGDGHPVWVRADAEGRYRFDGLTPGAWRVEGRDREPAREVLSVANRPEDEEFAWNVDIVDGVESALDVDMRHMGVIALHGRFLIDGQAPAGWIAELEPPQDTISRSPPAAVEIAEDGTYLLDAAAGRHTLKLSGPLGAHSRSEVMRDVDLTGPRFDYVSELTTGTLEAQVDAGTPTVRLVRGPYYEGEREITFVTPGPDGAIAARVPVGNTSLQVETSGGAYGRGWRSVRMVEVAPRD